MLDLFCGGGGASMGYFKAGFKVIGVDDKPQDNYPFTFIQSDALEYLRDKGHKYTFIHASPPCQKYSRAKGLSKARNNNQYGDHADLIEPTRRLLLDLNAQYIIENVPGSPLINPLKLYGSQFGLKTQRQRWFETNINGLMEPNNPMYRMKTPSAGNGVGPDGSISICGSGGVRGLNSKEILVYWSKALGGVEWMTRKEMSQCIPPIYTEFLGKQILGLVNATTAI